MLKSPQLYLQEEDENPNSVTISNIKHKFSKKRTTVERAINLGVFIVGLGTFVATLWVTWIAQNFSEKQAIRSESIEFLSKTNYYINSQWEINNKLISFLHTEAESKQTLLEHTLTPEDRLKVIQSYLQNDQEIEIALKQNQSLSLSLHKILLQTPDSEYKIYIIQSLREQKDVFTIIKYLNNALYHMTNDSFDLAENKLNLLIEQYTKIYNKNINDPASYLHTQYRSRLAAFYNLRALNKIKKTLAITDTSLYFKTLEAIALEDCKFAELLNPYNFYTYLHRSYIYKKLYEATNDSSLKKKYLNKIKTDILKAYEIAPLNPSVLIGLGLYHVTIGEDLIALARFKEAQLLYPHNPIVLYNLSKISLKLGKSKKDKRLITMALDYAEQAAQTQPGNVGLVTIYIDVVLQAKKCLKAKDGFETLTAACAKANKRCEREKTLETMKTKLSRIC